MHTATHTNQKREEGRKAGKRIKVNFFEYILSEYNPNCVTMSMKGARVWVSECVTDSVNSPSLCLHCPVCSLWRSNVFVCLIIFVIVQTPSALTALTPLTTSSSSSSSWWSRPDQSSHHLMGMLLMINYFESIGANLNIFPLDHILVRCVCSSPSLRIFLCVCVLFINYVKFLLYRAHTYRFFIIKNK